MRHDQDHGHRDEDVKGRDDTRRGERHALRARPNKVNSSQTQRPFTLSQSRSAFLSI
jgi:hypothetical protein